MSKFAVLTVLTGSVFYANAQLQTTINDFAFHSNLKGAHIGITVMETQTGQTLAAFNADHYFTPASVVKLISTAFALEVLGGWYRPQTRILTTGQILNHVLHGDVVIQGYGDPTIGSAYFTGHDTLGEMVYRLLKNAGVREIRGRLLLDDTRFSGFTPPGSWSWGDMGNYFGAFPSGINYADNSYKLTLDSPDSPGKEAGIKHIFPPIEIEFDNRIRTAEDPRDNAWIMGGPFGNTRLLTGTIPNSRGDFTIKGANPRPAESLGRKLAKHLREFADSLPVVTGPYYETDTTLLGVMAGPDIFEIAAACNKKSVNLFAEGLLLLAAYSKGCRNYDCALSQMRGWFEEQSRFRYAILRDACGLSRSNALSPEQIAAFLLSIQKKEWFSQWLGGLPVSGRSGTLARFGAGTQLSGQFTAKTGSMDCVQNLSGFLNKNNKKFVVIVFCENFVCSSAETRVLLEDLMLKIYTP